MVTKTDTLNALMSTSNATFNCSSLRDLAWDGYGAVDVPPPTTDPDISGLGVILAFIISAYLTWATVALGYCCGWIDERLLGNLDRRIFKIKPRSSNFWNPVLTKVVLILSDEQIVTGIAILIAGFAKRSRISVYHWHIVAYLAWMSSGTHLITLSVLRIYLREYPKLRIWRLCGMLMLCVMLFIAIVPTGSTKWFNIVYQSNFLELPSASSSVLATCFWNTSLWGGWRWEGAFTYILLVSNYLVRAGALFESSEQFFKQRIHDQPLAIIGARLDKLAEDLTRISNILPRNSNFRQSVHHVRLRTTYYSLLMIYCTILAVVDIYGSFAAPMLWVLFNLVWGTLLILLARYNTAEHVVLEESSWGFGQIMPLLLLILPFITMTEAFYEIRNPKSQTDVIPIVEETLDGQPSAFSCAEPSLQPILDGQTTATQEEVELSSLSATDQNLELGQLETGTTIDGERRWKGHHQDFYASKWFKALLWLVFAAIVSAASFVFGSFSFGFDLFQANGFDFWLFCVAPLVGVFFVWIPAGIPFSKVFR